MPERWDYRNREEVPDYDLLQDEVASATEGIDARRALELGTGSGVTSRSKSRWTASFASATRWSPLPRSAPGGTRCSGR